MTSSPAGPSSPRRPSTLLEAVSTQLRRDPGQPCLTFYDAATGERIELSWVTFDNWTSKVANLFTDELDAQPGDRITVTLPTHWLGPAVLFGAWAAGLVPAYGDAGGDAVVHVVGPDPLAAEPSGGTVLACSLRPLGGRFTEPLPSGWLDFAVEVPPQPDLLLMPAPVTSAMPATTSSSADVSHGDLVQAGLVRAGRARSGTGWSARDEPQPSRPRDDGDRPGRALVGRWLSGPGRERRSRPARRDRGARTGQLLVLVRLTRPPRARAR